MSFILSVFPCPDDYEVKCIIVVDEVGAQSFSVKNTQNGHTETQKR
ncbi:unnamed protein product, partial [Ascophyllum nodosum]